MLQFVFFCTTNLATPSTEIVFQTGIVIPNWLRPLNPRIAKPMSGDDDDDEEVETSEVKLYEVIKA